MNNTCNSTVCQLNSPHLESVRSMEALTINHILPTSSLLNPQDPSSSSSSSSSLTLQDGQQEDHESSFSYRVNVAVNNFISLHMQDVILLILSILAVSATLALGFYRSEELLLGPNCSRRLQANSFFVQDIKVKAAGQSEHDRVTLYGFLTNPALDIRTTWSESHNLSIPDNFHKEWIYCLNGQAQIDISYSVKPNASQPLILVIAQGRDSLSQWIGNPSYPNATLSWNLIHGNGMIQQITQMPSDYYVAVGNPNDYEVEVQVDFRIQNLMYNTTGAYYQCSLGHNTCVLNLFFQKSIVPILMTSGPQQGGRNGETRIKLSFGPQWITYAVCSGFVTSIFLLVLKLCDTICQSRQQNSEVSTGRSPLLTNKEDDNSSLGSSYDSVSHDEDEDDRERGPNASSKLVKGEDKPDKSHQLCAICCDAQKDCFFLPCGHCATCFTCGTRIADNGGTCPICCRRMKKVRKIFAV